MGKWWQFQFPMEKSNSNHGKIMGKWWKSIGYSLCDVPSHRTALNFGDSLHIEHCLAVVPLEGDFWAMLQCWLHFLVFEHVWINGNFRILKWRWIFPYIGLIYGRYLQYRSLKWPLIERPSQGTSTASSTTKRLAGKQAVHSMQCLRNFEDGPERSSLTLWGIKETKETIWKRWDR